MFYFDFITWKLKNLNNVSWKNDMVTQKTIADVFAQVANVGKYHNG